MAQSRSSSRPRGRSPTAVPVHNRDGGGRPKRKNSSGSRSPASATEPTVLPKTSGNKSSASSAAANAGSSKGPNDSRSKPALSRLVLVLVLSLEDALALGRDQPGLPIRPVLAHCLGLDHGQGHCHTLHDRPICPVRGVVPSPRLAHGLIRGHPVLGLGLGPGPDPDPGLGLGPCLGLGLGLGLVFVSELALALRLLDALFDIGLLLVVVTTTDVAVALPPHLQSPKSQS
ncbi:hypothetical protein BSLG_000985 [Batrachochytrium salamandrivorans]|nr:hypothetical protein BSLG_000985 [Batrachochytrium salamandrivorans]